MLRCPRCGGNVVPHPLPPPRGDGPDVVNVCLQCGRQPEPPSPPPPLTPPDPTKRSHIDAAYRARKKWRARVANLCKRCGIRKPAKGYRQCDLCRRRGKPQED